MQGCREPHSEIVLQLGARLQAVQVREDLLADCSIVCKSERSRTAIYAIDIGLPRPRNNES